MSAGGSAASLLLALVNDACAARLGINIHSRDDGGGRLWGLAERVALQTAWGLAYVGCCQSANWAPAAILTEQVSKRALSKPRQRFIAAAGQVIGLAVGRDPAEFNRNGKKNPF